MRLKRIGKIGENSCENGLGLEGVAGKGVVFNGIGINVNWRRGGWRGREVKREGGGGGSWVEITRIYQVYHVKEICM